MRVLACAVLLSLLSTSCCSPQEASVLVTIQCTEEGLYKLHSGVISPWCARANFTDNIFTDGWSYLEVETNQSYPDVMQAYAAGYAEGIASHSIIYNSWRNTLEGYCKWKGQKLCERLRKFIKMNMDWMLSMIKAEAPSSSYWYQVNLVLQQLSGLAAGYNAIAKHPLNYEQILWLNMMGDLEDLATALDSAKTSMTLEEWVASGHIPGDGHCSALIKVLPGNVDLYVSQVTWNSYQSMLRVLKKYILPFRLSKAAQPDDIIPGYAVSFSSYPAVLHSGDDFYVISTGLTTLETTIGNSNPALWSNISAVGEMQEWIRVLVSNRIAKTGQEWTKTFSLHNSGTYNNQWMVVDYKLFQFGRPLRPNTLWVLEQIPSLIVAADQTQVLRHQSYWPSYNVPFYPTVFNLSGLPALVERYGNWFSYDKTPRALIFKRDQGSVKNMEAMIRLMRYNDFRHDPLSRCNCTPPFSAENAISARNDLNPKNGTYPFGSLGHRSHGGTDAKITTSKLSERLQFLAINGPTYDQQPVFRWSEQDFAKDTPHYGHPDAWKFPVVHHQWHW